MRARGPVGCTPLLRGSTARVLRVLLWPGLRGGTYGARVTGGLCLGQAWAAHRGRATAWAATGGAATQANNGTCQREDAAVLQPARRLRPGRVGCPPRQCSRRRRRTCDAAPWPCLTGGPHRSWWFGRQWVRHGRTRQRRRGCGHYVAAQEGTPSLSGHHLPWSFPVERRPAPASLRFPLTCCLAGGGVFERAGTP